jgi:23S rRNA (cytidine2498-2'-O)-methyltransferase
MGRPRSGRGRKQPGARARHGQGGARGHERAGGHGHGGERKRNERGLGERGRGERAPPDARRRFDRAGERKASTALPERTLPLPDGALAPGAPPAVGEHLWTTRPGAERDLLEELWLQREGDGRVVGPSLLASRQAPRDALGRLALTFARQSFEVYAQVSAESGDLGPALCHAATAALPRTQPWSLQLWVPDADATNPLTARLPALERAVRDALQREPSRAKEVVLERHAPQDTQLLQIAVVSETRAYLGLTRVGEALSLAPGGRERMRVSARRPSRAARKLEEAFRWAGMAPGPGESCVDLGAAPGGWTFVVRARGARAVAVDPARLAPEIAADRGVRHVPSSAFDFEPDATVDFLLCDMAFRPLDVAALLGKWARRRWARALIANFKLPMKRRAEMARHLCAQLTEAGWKDVRSRQLYHDRDEITVCARL